MKILYHHRIRSKDGQYVHVDELTRALKEIGHEIIMVGPAATEEENFGADAGLVATLKKWLPQFVYEILEFCYSIPAYFRLKKAIEKHQPDVIYERYNLYFPAGIWAKKKYKLPFLLEVNAPLYNERKKYDGISIDSFAKWTENYAWRNADYCLPVTKVLGQHVIDAGVPEDKLRIVPNGINKARFNNTQSLGEAKHTVGLSADKVVLGFVGFVRDWHGLEYVVDMIADSRDEARHLLLVGDGPARESIEKRAAERGITKQVTITGVVGRDEMAKYISAFDVALQPAVVAYASPLKLFEYLELGRAIVAPATPNIKEILTDKKNALLFEPDNLKDFAAKVEDLCQDEKLRTELGAAAKAAIDEQKLTWINNAERVEKLFNELLKANNK